MLVKTKEFTQSLSLELLFDYWRLAEVRTKAWKKPLKCFKVPRQYNHYQNWQLELDKPTAEIERRADLFPIEAILELIDKGHSFRFNR